VEKRFYLPLIITSPISALHQSAHSKKNIDPSLKTGLFWEYLFPSLQLHTNPQHPSSGSGSRKSDTKKVLSDSQGIEEDLLISE